MAPKAALRALLVLIVGVWLIGGAIAYTATSRPFSAHEQPSRVEALLARTMRRLATPEAVRTRRNPVQLTETVVERALAHYAVALHRVPRQRRQRRRRDRPRSLAESARHAPRRHPGSPDGELFWIIENGIRFTGMPGWSTGTKDGET